MNYYKQQQFAKASEEYSKAIATDPSNATAKFNQANALYKQDKKVEAAKIFAEVAMISGIRKSEPKPFIIKE